MNRIEENKAELWKEIKKLCSGSMSYQDAERLVICHKAYKILCEMSEVGRDDMELRVSGSERAIAEAWTAGMENKDGTIGPHWTLERIKQEMEQRGIKCNLYEFWAVINSIYSDDVAVAKKHNVNTMEYYVDRATAWIEDQDAVPDKAAAYYTYVVKH